MAESNFFPFVGVESDYVANENTELPLFKELAWDFDKDRFIIDSETKNFKVLEGKKALEVWIYHAIKTVRYEHEIYSWDYGTEIVNLIGQKFTKGLTESEAFRYIKEALMINSYILDVRKNDITLEGDRLKINITVDTVYGEVDIFVQ